MQFLVLEFLRRQGLSDIVVLYSRTQVTFPSSSPAQRFTSAVNFL